MSARTELVLRTALVIVTALAIIGLARVLIQLTEILLLVLIAAILATGIAPLVEALQQRRWTRRRVALSRVGAIAVVYLGLFLALGFIAGVVITPVVLETQGFVENLPENVRRLEDTLAASQARYPWLPDLAAIVRRLPQELGRLSRFFAPAAGVAFRVLGGLASVVTVLVLAFYMLVEGPAIREGFLALFPRSDRKKIGRVLDDVGRKFGGWLRGQLLLGLIIGTAAAVGMAAIGMPYPLLLGLIAGVTELIPVVGPVLGAIPAIFLAIFQPPWWKLAFTILWYAAIQQVEGNVLVPRVMRRAVGLSPLLTVIALVVGAKLLGLVGALLAVPVAAALQVVVGEILKTFRPQD